MATLQQAIDAIQAKVRNLSGIRAAPDEPPEGTAVFPFAICYAASGSWSIGNPAGMTRGLHTVNLEIHCARNNLASNVATAMAYSETVVNAIASDPTLAGACDTIAGEIEYRFGMMEYGGVQTIGWQFSIPIKQHQTVT